MGTGVANNASHMAGINNNVLSQGMQRRLLAAESQAARALQRLSSGLRVHSAKDDAAGLGMATRLDVNVRAAVTLTRGVMDGISLAQTADGGLGQIQQALQRGRELAIQAANGTLGDEDRQALDVEYQQLIGLIDQVANATAGLGVHLLRGAGTAGKTPSLVDLFGSASGSTVTLASGIKPVAYIPTGAVNVRLDITSYSADDDIQVFARDGTHLVGTPLGDNVWRSNGVFTAADVAAKTLSIDNGFLPEATYQGPPAAAGDGAYNPAGTALSLGVNGMSIGYSGDGDYQDGGADDGVVGAAYQRELVQVDQATEPLMVMVVGSGIFTATATWDFMPSQVLVPPAPPGLGPVDVMVQADHDGAKASVRIEQMPADGASLGVSVTSLRSADGSRAAVDALDTALDRISGYRGSLGALNTRFDTAIDNLAVAKQSQSAARGRIVDADMADASAQLAQASIQTNACLALIAQAQTAMKDVVRQLLTFGRS